MLACCTHKNLAAAAAAAAEKQKSAKTIKISGSGYSPPASDYDRVDCARQGRWEHSLWVGAEPCCSRASLPVSFDETSPFTCEKIAQYACRPNVSSNSRSSPIDDSSPDLATVAGGQL